MTPITSSSDITPITEQWYRLETTDPVTLTFRPTTASDLFYIYNEADLDLTNVTFVLNGATIENIYIISDAITASMYPMYGNFICAEFYVRHDLNVLYGTISGAWVDDTHPKRSPTLVADVLMTQPKQKNILDISSYIVYVSTVYIPTYTEPTVSDPYIPDTSDVPVYDSFYTEGDVESTEVVLNEEFGTVPLYMIIVT
jgi:hypothetical protein